MVEGFAKLDVREETTFEERQSIREFAQNLSRRYKENEMAVAASPVTKIQENGEVLITSAQACKMLNVTRRTLYMWMEQGLISSTRLKTGKKEFRISKSSVETFIREKKGKTSTENRKSGIQVTCNGPCGKTKPRQWIDSSTGICKKCLEKQNTPEPQEELKELLKLEELSRLKKTPEHEIQVITDKPVKELLTAFAKSLAAQAELIMALIQVV